MIGTGTSTRSSSSTMRGTAAAASSLLTVTRTSSLPARASAATCRTVAATSAVSVLVMDWTTIGCPEPTGTPPTRTVTVERRMVGGMGGNITSCMPETPPEGIRRAAITGVATYVPERVVTNADLAQQTRHLRRVDRHPDRHPRAPPRRPGGDHRQHGRGGGAPADGRQGARPRRCGRPHRRHRDTRHALPRHRVPDPGPAGPASESGGSTSPLPAPASSTP